MKPAIARPDSQIAQRRGSEQVHLYVAYAPVKQAVLLDEVENLIVCCHRGAFKLSKQSQRVPSVTEVSACQLPSHQRCITT